MTDEAKAVSDSDEKDSEKIVEPTLKELLGDWDEHATKTLSFDQEDEDVIDPRDEKITEFESQVEALENERTELAERAEKAEADFELVEKDLTRIDQHDHDQLVERFASEVGVSKRTAKLELHQRAIEDEELVAAFDDRLDNPERFESRIADLMQDVQEKYPRREDPRGPARAARIARSSHDNFGSFGWSGNSGEDGYGYLPGMNDQEFATASRQVFEDMKSGKLRPQ